MCTSTCKLSNAGSVYWYPICSNSSRTLIVVATPGLQCRVPCKSQLPVPRASRRSKHYFAISYMHNDGMCMDSTHSGYLLLPNLVVGCSWAALDGVKDHSSVWKVVKTICLYIVWPNHAYFPKDGMCVWQSSLWHCASGQLLINACSINFTHRLNFLNLAVNFPFQLHAKEFAKRCKGRARDNGRTMLSRCHFQQVSSSRVKKYPALLLVLHN